MRLWRMSLGTVGAAAVVAGVVVAMPRAGVTEPRTAAGGAAATATQDECDSGPGIPERMPLDVVLADESKTWVTVSAPGTHRLVRPGRTASDIYLPEIRDVDVRVEGVLRESTSEPLDARALTSLHMAATTAAQVADVPAGTTLVMAVYPGDEAAAAYAVLALRPDGDVAFLGDCASRAMSAPLGRFFEQRARAGDDRSRHALLLGIVGDPAGPEARALGRYLHDRPSWHDLPADARTVGYGSQPATPDSVLAELTEVTLSVDLPATWRAFPAILCTRLSVGWGECAKLDAAAQGPFVITGLMEPRRDLELWLMGPDARYASRIGRIGTVPARLAKEGAVVAVSARTPLATLDDLVRVARTTHDALAVRPG